MNDFRLYRFSPIRTQEELVDAINYIHFACHNLCKGSFGKYLPVAGNVGVFCHYDDEFESLKIIRSQLTVPSSNSELKYFTLLEPIVVSAKDDIPEATYTHLYIRKPDPYRAQVGDIDFYLPEEEHSTLKRKMVQGKEVPGARVFERSDLDMIELFNPGVDALGYVSTSSMTEKVRIKLSDATKL